MAAGELPDGIFCANDLLALGVMQSLTMTHRLRIPEDIALIGYDDIDFAVSAVVPLSSIRQPTEAIGRTAIELLVEEVESEQPAAPGRDLHPGTGGAPKHGPCPKHSRRRCGYP